MEISVVAPGTSAPFTAVLFTATNREQVAQTFSDLSPETWDLQAGKKQLLPYQHGLLLLQALTREVQLEHIRKALHQIVCTANDLGIEQVQLVGLTALGLEQAFTAAAEAAILSNYQFNTYRSTPKIPTLTQLQLVGDDTDQAAVKLGEVMAQAACQARDLVNEPVITLTATEFSHRIETLGDTYGFSVEVLGKPRLQSLKMGGILAVNAGSIEPPTFSILEYKPQTPVNEHPIVLVGKGVVYDTGGLSLKPTANSMDFMKADMAGAAAVVGAFCGMRDAGVELHVIGLIPATDNRPGQNAYVPGDVIKMYDGTTVEVLNTDAEGRLILADALAYAKQYKPELVIDLATLTGAKVIAIGSQGLAMMRTADDATKDQFVAAGARVYERLVELPLWDEYGDLLKSDIADMKNIGGREAGSITAGKFLQHFTDYPWIHLDIAGSAWRSAPDSYRGKNGTGIGVRLLLAFLLEFQQQG